MSKELKKKLGRKSDYTDEIADFICEELIDGKSLRTICAEAPNLTKPKVLRWLNTFEYFRDQYKLAREMQTEGMFDDLLDIADDGTNDWMEKRDKDGDNIGWQVNGEAIQRSKLRIDARKWAASKLMPKKYGDKVLHGSDPENPIEPVYSDRQVARAILELLHEAQTEETLAIDITEEQG